jgi:hypothetical protein
MIEGVIGIGVYNDDAATFNTGVSYWQQRVLLSHRRRSTRAGSARHRQLVYDPSIDGISQETCRDFGHDFLLAASMLEWLYDGRVRLPR